MLVSIVTSVVLTHAEVPLSWRVATYFERSEHDTHVAGRVCRVAAAVAAVDATQLHRLLSELDMTDDDEYYPACARRRRLDTLLSAQGRGWSTDPTHPTLGCIRHTIRAQLLDGVTWLSPCDGNCQHLTRYSVQVLDQCSLWASDNPTTTTGCALSSMLSAWLTMLRTTAHVVSVVPPRTSDEAAPRLRTLIAGGGPGGLLAALHSLIAGASMLVLSSPPLAYGSHPRLHANSANVRDTGR